MRALAARACAHPLDRHGGGARHAGRARGADRRRRAGRRAEADPAHAGAAQPPADIALRNRDGSDARLRAAARSCRPTGCASSAKRSRWWSPRPSPAAKDAAERVVVDYEPLEPVTATAGRGRRPARRGSTSTVANVCIDADVGDAAATEAAFARAAACGLARHLGAARHRRADGAARRGRRLRRGDAAATRCTPAAAAWCGRRHELAGILGVAGQRRCASMRATSAAISAPATPSIRSSRWCAGRRSGVGRPVKWTCERIEAFLSDYQGRDQAVQAELALDADGHFLALRGSNTSNVGAHSVIFVPLVKGVELMTSVYAMPAAHFRARAVLTNTPPTNPYRSAGRPEAMFVIERLIDLAARAVRLRPGRRCGGATSSRRRPQPYANPLGMTYDSGDYEKAMDARARARRLEGLRQAQAASRRRQRQAARHRARQLHRG